MYSPTKEYADELSAQGFGAIPVSRQMLSDVRTPIEVLRALMENDRHCFILESAEDRQHWGRYTFLGFDPMLDIVCRDGRTRIVRDGIDEAVEGDPRDAMRSVLGNYRSPRVEGMPPFTGGLVGYFSYDFIKYAEPSLTLDASDDEGFEDLDLMLFDKIIAFDNFRQTLSVIVNVIRGRRTYQEACDEIESVMDIIRRGAGGEHQRLTLGSDFRPRFDKGRFCGMVETVKDHIREGDVFQVVLSNRLEADMEGSLLDAYRVLRTTNPSPYMFYFKGSDIEVAGASPETLVKLTGTDLVTFPLAGTRPRGRTEEEDRALESELLSDEKELAEHNMLVDLGRNDIGRVSEFGSVTVDRYLEVERFSHVMHLGSTVHGRIRGDMDAIDAIGSVLPAGTLSGAPKIEACRIIDRLEGCKRGIYGGAFGYIDLSGNMDVCIGIRLAYRKDDKVFVRSGAGIVADSVPEREFEECINKARAVVEAIRTASEGVE